MLKKTHQILQAPFILCIAFLLTSPFLLRTSQACPPPPDPPTLTSLQALSPSAQRLTWSQSYGASEYRIYRSTNGSSFSYLQTAYSTTADIGGLSAGTRYWYRVTAWNSSGKSNYSNTLDGWTKPEAPVLTSIAALSATSIHIQSNIPGGAVSGIGKRAPVVNGQVGAYEVIATNITFPAYTDTGLQPFQQYSYKAIAVNAGGGQSDESNALSAWTRLAAPVISSVTPISETVLRVSWQSVTSATDYRIYRSDSGAPGSYVQRGQVQAPTLYYDDAGVPVGSQLFYRVSALHNGVEGDISDPYSHWVPIPTPTPAPTQTPGGSTATPTPAPTATPTPQPTQAATPTMHPTTTPMPTNTPTPSGPTPTPGGPTPTPTITPTTTPTPTPYFTFNNASLMLNSGAIPAEVFPHEVEAGYDYSMIIYAPTTWIKFTNAPYAYSYDFENRAFKANIIPEPDIFTSSHLLSTSELQTTDDNTIEFAYHTGSRVPNVDETDLGARHVSLDVTPAYGEPASADMHLQVIISSAKITFYAVPWEGLSNEFTAAPSYAITLKETETSETGQTIYVNPSFAERSMINGTGRLYRLRTASNMTKEQGTPSDQHMHYLSGLYRTNNLVFYKTSGPGFSSQDAARFSYDYTWTQEKENDGGPSENHIYRSCFNASTYRVHGLKAYVDAKMSVFDSADCSYAPPIAFVSDIATVEDAGAFSEWRNVWQDRRHLDIFLEPGPALPGHPQALGVSMKGCDELGIIYKKVTKNN